MKKLSLQMVTLTVGIGLIAGLAGCCSMVRSCLHQAIIVKQPESRAVLTNADVTFSVVAVAGPPFSTNGVSYQWQFNGIQLDETNLNLNWTDLPGATSSSIMITNAQTNNVGFYRVLVSGSATNISDPASLQLIVPGSITVYGTPVVSSGSKSGCPGTYAGYVKYPNSPPTLWGWAVINPSVAASGSNAGSASNPRVEYLGWYGDTGCATSSVFTSSHPLSPRYVFTIYFNSPVPSGSYPISLGNLQ